MYKARKGCSDFKVFKKVVLKRRDAWSEVLLVDPITTPLAYAIYKVLDRYVVTPYAITFSSFIVRVFSALSFLTSPIRGSILFFLSIILDGIDGKVARAMFGYDPTLRGLLDFLLDNIGLGVAFVALFRYIIDNEINNCLMPLFILVTLFMINHASISSKFRLQAVRGDNKSVSELMSNNFFVKVFLKVQSKFDDLRVMFHPSSVDAELIIFVISPLLGYNVFLLWVAAIFMLIDTIIMGLASSLILARGMRT